MTEQELQSLEERIGSTLPQVYRALLLEFPPELKVANRLDYEDENGQPVMFATSHRELCDSLESLVALNCDDPENYQFSAKLEKWPNAFFIIGSNDSGGVWAINLNDDNAAVHFADQSTSIFDPDTDGLEGYFEQEAPSVRDWADRLIAAHRS